MHEYAYADRVLQSVIEYMQKTGKREPPEVEVEVGELLALTRTSLTTAYAILSRDTPAEGSRIKVRITKSSVGCPRCGFTGRLRPKRGSHVIDPSFGCPKCGAPVKIVSGMEMNLVHVG